MARCPEIAVFKGPIVPISTAITRLYRKAESQLGNDTILSMDQEEEYVKRQEFEALASGLLGIIGQMGVTLSALALILRERGIVTADLWKKVVDEAAYSDWAKKVRAAVEKLSPSSPLAEVLKDFEGPLQ
jgi:hypothetical protein